MEKKPVKITKEQAIEIARKVIEGKVTLQDGAPVNVKHEQDRYIVTFVHITPPDELGPDYDAQVTINANTGEVLEVLGGT